MIIKSFECPKYIRNYGEKKMSDDWSKICWSHQHSEPAYYIVDYWILRLWSFLPLLCCMIVQQSFDPLQIFLLLEL